MSWELTPLIETAMTTGTVGGQFISQGPMAGAPLFWQVASDSKRRWTKSGLKVGKRRRRTPQDDEKERRKFLKKFSLMSLFRRESISEGTSIRGIDHIHSRQPVGIHRMPDAAEISKLPIKKTKSQGTKPEDIFLKDKSFLDKLPHKGTETEKLTDKQWSSIQKAQNKSTTDPRWPWKRRLRYAGGVQKDYDENKSFELTAMV